MGAHVTIMDHCTDMPAAYALSDLVIHASTDPEAFGRVVAEAQAMGKPVIASEDGATSKIIEHGKTGWLFPTGRDNFLARLILQSLSLSFSQRKDMAQKAIRRIQERFSKELMCSKTLDLYDEVLSEHT
jgi:glycosyltransferase involved in cell wall biosynthesis